MQRSDAFSPSCVSRFTNDASRPPIDVINLDSVLNRFRFTWTAFHLPIEASAQGNSGKNRRQGVCPTPPSRPSEGGAARC